MRISKAFMKYICILTLIYFLFRKDKDLTVEDLSLLCDLFYLPFEHGGQGLQLLQEFNWLKSNAHVVIEANQKKDCSKPEVDCLRHSLIGSLRISFL